MSFFESPDLLPLWDRPPDFLPRQPAGGAHRWRYETVRSELVGASERLAKEAAERRVALLAHPELDACQATEGLHVGVQLLLAGESAAPHRHTPAALRIGLEGRGIVTTVDDHDVAFDPLDVVLNPSGTWHGHHDGDGAGGSWLDVVDLPMVAALGGVFFEPDSSHSNGSLLDPPHGVPATIRFPWADIEPELDAAPAVDGVRHHRYGGGSVLPTLAVTAYAVEPGATLRLPACTAGAVALVGRGRFGFGDVELDRFDVVALRTWTAAGLTGRDPSGTILVVDTSPALRSLGLYREAPAA